MRMMDVEDLTVLTGHRIVFQNTPETVVRGTIIAVEDPADGPRLVVQWDDGHETSRVAAYSPRIVDVM